MIRQTYEALTDPSRLIGFLIDQDTIGVTEGGAVYLQGGASDQVQAWLRDLLHAGVYYGAQEGVGAALALQTMTEQDYPETYDSGRAAKAELVATRTEIRELVAKLREAEADESAGVDERDLAGHFAEKLEGLL